MRDKDILVQACAQKLGENVRRLRKERHLSQERLSGMMGTQHPRISNFESGFVDVRLSDIVDLARMLEVELADVLDLADFALADYPASFDDGHARL